MRRWWSRLLCWLGSHDWRNMDGRCAECGYEDDLFHGDDGVRA